MRADHGGLADLAASVADGTPVDWSAVELRSRPADRRMLGHLRLVESIASLHRSIPSEGTDADENFASGPLGAPWTDDSVNRAAASGPHWGRLSLLERIGEGTSCEVYRAWDTSLHREVALKLLHEEGSSREARTRILDEARRLARIRHQHVVQVYGAEQQDSRVGLWMELVRGESLEHVVKVRGTFGPREAALIGLDLCSALAAVHAAGLLHRDVKAQNVMREERGRIVLMDFGTGEELSGTNRLVGTPLYLAPEIFRGQKASVQSDLYSLGVLLFYLVTGKFPVIAGSMELLARAHALRQRQPLRDLRPDAPEAFVGAIERALDSDPTRRFQSVGDFEQALRESVVQPSTLPVAPASGAVTVKRLRPRLAFASAAVVLAALVSALIVWTGQIPGIGGATIKSLAVLPLDEGSSVATGGFTDGVTEQLIATIGQIDSLRTTSLMSALPFKGDSRPPTEIASLLGVDAVLKGSLHMLDEGSGTPGDTSQGRQGNNVRLDASLIAAGSGSPLWSGSFEGTRGEVRAVLARAVRELAKAVNAPVTGAEEVRLRQVKTTSPAAEEAYLQGRLHLARFGPDAAQQALQAFQRAFTFDSKHGAAHAGAALAYVRLGGTNRLSSADARGRARSEIRLAFESGEDIAEAHAAEADLRFLYDWDWDGAERELRRSLDLNSSFIYARDVYAQLLASRRRFPEAIKISEETLLMDPQSVEGLINHGMILYYKKDLAGAEEVSRRAIAAQPDGAAGYVLAGRVAEALGRYDEALDLMHHAWQLVGDGGVNLRILVIRLQALSGKQDEGRKAAEDLQAAAAAGKVRVRHRDMAYLYLGLGQTAASLDAFEKAFDERDPSLVWLTVDPRVDALRGDKRFESLLQNLNRQ